MTLPKLMIEYPAWVETSVDWTQTYSTDEEKVGLAIELSRLNVEHGSGGPFGAAVFERESGRLLSVGMNLVVAHNNCILHAEIVAFMMAQTRLQSYTLKLAGHPEYELASSCEPCAMCLGATLWSGVSRILCGAGREDAQRLKFDEGPVFPESYTYLETRGIEIARGVRRDEAAEVLELYRQGNGIVYNR